MIEAIDATLKYLDSGREVFACQSVNLSLNPNEFVGILGPSGSGKSSLLYLLSGLKIPTEGEVRYLGRNIGAMSDSERASLRLSEFGFVFQQPYLLGYLTALENVSIANGGGLYEARGLLTSLGIGHLEHRFPHELSGGERQRVCVARALMGSPKVIFADEPTASLDHANGVQVVELLNAHRGGGTLVMVTHDSTMLDDANRILDITEGMVSLGEATRS